LIILVVVALDVEVGVPVLPLVVVPVCFGVVVVVVVVVPGPVVVPPPAFIGVVIGVDVVPPVPVFVVVPLPPLLPICVEGVLPGRKVPVRHCPRWFGAAAVPNGQSPSGDCTCFEQVVIGRLGPALTVPTKPAGQAAEIPPDSVTIFTSGVTTSISTGLLPFLEHSLIFVSMLVLR
jgi:hypothetical protein